MLRKRARQLKILLNSLLVLPGKLRNTAAQTFRRAPPILLVSTLARTRLGPERSILLPSLNHINIRETKVSRTIHKNMSSATDNFIAEKAKVANKSADTDCILWQWATHTSDSFHSFSTDEASAIRSALLDWYWEKRRKLPWRGDKGPFDGSTAGVASTNSKAKKKAADKKPVPGQKNITAFFTKSKPVEKGDGRIKEDKKYGCSLTQESAIEVTGYSVWVSEIMLQQTRVEAVIPYYLKWMKRFPAVEDLANATEDEVNSHWAGLGFYRRARLLHQGAKFVVKELDGVVPENVDALMKISGIGRYTASAIASIAFDKCVPVVDGNVCRVLARLKGVANNIKAPVFKDRLGWILAEQLVAAGDGKHAGEVNQAIMELGATYCAPSGSGIDPMDPLIDFYMSTTIGRKVDESVNSDALAMSDFVSKAAMHRKDSYCSLCEGGGVSNVLFQLGDDMTSLQNESRKSNLSRSDLSAMVGHARFPTNPPKKAKREEILGVVALCHALNGNANVKWFMVKRYDEGLLAGQWEFPMKSMWSSSEDGKKKSKSEKAIELPTIQPYQRRDAINNMLHDFVLDVDGSSTPATLQAMWKSRSTRRIVVNQAPIEHVFSHVRWSMHCEHGDLSSSMRPSLVEKDVTAKDGRECRWMTEQEMAEVGITSSVKKILAAVNSIRFSSSSKRRKLN